MVTAQHEMRQALLASAKLAESDGDASVDGVPRQLGRLIAPEEIADGFLEIAVANMANAIKHISVERGYDVTEYTLCCFGGAGGQHACAVADALGMTRVFGMYRLANSMALLDAAIRKVGDRVTLWFAASRAVLLPDEAGGR